VLPGDRVSVTIGARLQIAEEALARLWRFPSLLRLQQYTALLDEHGFEILLVSGGPYPCGIDATPQGCARDQEQWETDFAARYGDAEHQR
jgi:hypothetical protein